MKLTFQQLTACTKGAAVVAENADGSIFLRRMTEEQCAVYPNDTMYYRCGHDSAGIALDFYTDAAACTVFLGTNEAADIPVDVLIDGTLYASHTRTQAQNAAIPFLLPEGEKRVTVYLPHYLPTDRLSVDLPDGATFRPYTHSRRLVAFGDSITQGYSASSPARTYMSLLGQMLDAEVCNYGIAGQRFYAKKILGDYPEADLVTVAYGTNDFGHKVWSRAEFETNMTDFFVSLHTVYPTTPTFVLLPLWRADENQPANDIPTLQTVRDRVAEEAKKYENITVIDCTDFIPHLRKHFADAKLHPNNSGMAFYAENLYNAITEVL